MNDVIYINGKFLLQNKTGIQRHAFELIKAIDYCISISDKFKKFNFVILVPKKITYVDFHFKNIKILCKNYYLCSFFWEQLILPIITYNKLLLNFTGSSPALKINQYCTYADMAIFDAPNAYKSFYILFYRVLYKYQSLFIKKFYTISFFSKKRINNLLNISQNKIIVLGCSAEHFLSLAPNDSILAKIKKNFFLCVGSNNSNKNLNIVIDLFISNKYFDNFQLVIVGNFSIDVFSKNNSTLSSHNNIFFTGNVSDSELKSLYKNAIAFIFPSIYEGFGIPPLEAMICGCPVIASKIDVLEEVCGTGALYFNPYSSYDLFINLFLISRDYSLRNNLIKLGYVRSKNYSWQYFASKILEDLMIYQNHYE